MLGILGAVGRALAPVAAKTVSNVVQLNKKKNEVAQKQQVVQPVQPIIQQSAFDMDGLMAQLNQQNNTYMQQMQNYYNQQMQQFQSQLDSQKLVQTQNNNYQQQNQRVLNNGVNGIIGSVYNPQVNQAQRGAHIKVNNTGQPAAISRYLAQDIWKNK